MRRLTKEESVKRRKEKVDVLGFTAYSLANPLPPYPTTNRPPTTTVKMTTLGQEINHKLDSNIMNSKNIEYHLKCTKEEYLE